MAMALYYGMGLIACTTPGRNIGSSVPRINVTAEEVANLGKVEIRYSKPVEGNVSIDICSLS